MNFFSNISESIQKKKAEWKDRKDYLDMVEECAKPIRRKAYADQTMIEAIKEGKQKAKLDSAKKLQEKKSPMDFGIKGIEDPYKFINPTKKIRKENKK